MIETTPKKASAKAAPKKEKRRSVRDIKLPPAAKPYVRNGKLVVPTQKTGPPKMTFNWEQVGEMFGIQCTITEVCGVLGCCYDTLAKACLADNGFTIAELKESKTSDGKRSLRKAQFDVATKSKNPVMLIWLGKNYLAQTDKTETTDKDPGEVAKQIQAALNDIQGLTSGEIFAERQAAKEKA